MESLETRRLLATLSVTSDTDQVDANPGDGVCEISAGGACTLRAAIQEANALVNSGEPDRIQLPAGTFTLSLAGMNEQRALSGDLDITDDLVLQGSGASVTIIDGGDIDRVIDVVRGSVTIEGVTVRGGLIDGDDDPVEGSGGGIRNEGELTVSESRVTGNRSTFGAGIANYNGTLKISRSVISGNGNNDTRRGGGISNYSNYDPARLDISNSTIADNRGDEGGGIANRSYDGMAEATIANSTISGNISQQGAGISNRSVVFYSGIGSNVIIRGSTISGNVAQTSGGGIRSETDEGGNALVDISNTTISANAATSGQGGGILSVADASLILESVIVAGNSSGDDGADLFSDATTASFSLIENSSGHSLVGGVDNNIVGQSASLAALADNGGSTLTHSLLPGSAAIDQGANPNGLVGDQRGSAFVRTVDDPRISNASDGTDIGAVEVGQVAATHDFGDAPSGIMIGGTIRQYPTQLVDNGARHRVTTGGPKLGSVAPDAEPDGQSTASASGDDLVGFDDEDSLGIDPIVLEPGQSLAGLSISHDGGDSGARLSAWIDFNLDGDWDDANEQILADASVSSGGSVTSLENITTPLGALSGTTFLRVRISTESGLTTRGEAIDGEVEDFLVTIGTPPPQVADLSLTQTVSDANPVLGQDVVFTITLTNDGPDRATNVEVTDFLPFDLIFQSSSVSQGQYDDLDGFWFVGNLDAGATAVLRITATVDSTDPLTNTAEVTASDQIDPDSTPGNGISGEDDQFSIAVGTCLSSGPVHVGMNQLTFSCASPGSFSAFVRGSERGLRTFPQYSTTVDIADAEEIAIAIADSNGIAVAFYDVSEEEFQRIEDGVDTLLVQAFEMIPGSRKSNTLALDAEVQLLRAAEVGPGRLSLQPEVLPEIIDAAISQWQKITLSASQDAALLGTRVTISDLPGNSIARVAGRTIVIDHDAAGNGWFVDSTPGDHQELAANANASAIEFPPAANGHVDLLTALVHEFGHILGVPDLLDSENVMHGTLEAGVRRLPTSDTNARDSLDVNNDGIVSALDALIVINRLNRTSKQVLTESSLWVGTGGHSNPYLDVNSDFRVSASDALIVINHLDDAGSRSAGRSVAASGEFLIDRHWNEQVADKESLLDEVITTISVARQDGRGRTI